MKKTLSIFAFVALALFFFSGCDKYDEIYNPKCMISKIWYRSDVNPDVNPEEGIHNAPANETYYYNEDDQITSIKLADEERIYNFTYDEYGYTTAISYVNKWGLTESISYTYKGEKKKKFMTGLEYKIDGVVRQTVAFTRRADHTIASVDVSYDREFFHGLDQIEKSMFYNRFIGYNENAIEVMQKSDSKELTRKSLTQVFYNETSMNIIKTVMTIPDDNYVETTTYEYDDGLNPFFEMPFSYCAHYNEDNHSNTRGSKYNFLIGFSKNNKTLEATDIKLLGNGYNYFKIMYTYEYNEKNYPRKITEKSTTYNEVPTSTYILYVSE